MKHGLWKILIAGLVGGVGWYVGGYATQKSDTLNKNMWILPVLLLGIGLLLFRRGRVVSGAALASLGGAIAVLGFQIRQSQKAAAGVDRALADAGARPDSGLYDRPASAGAFAAYHKDAGATFGREGRMPASFDASGAGATFGMARGAPASFNAAYGPVFGEAGAIFQPG